MLERILTDLNGLDTADLRRVQTALAILLAARDAETEAQTWSDEGAETASDRLAQRDTRRASLQVEYRRCGRPTCRCARGAKHGPYLYLAYRQGGKVIREYKGKV